MSRKFILLFGAFTLIIASTCSKQQDRPEDRGNDMFPLEINNKFYYTYSYSTVNYQENYYIIGKEAWTVISRSQTSTTTLYKIERKLNGIYYKRLEVSPFETKILDTIVIHDSIRILKVIEDNQSSELKILFRGDNPDSEPLRLMRYNPTMTEKTIYSGIAGHDMTFRFNAWKGLTYYYLSDGVMQVRTRESLKQDSVKIST